MKVCIIGGGVIGVTSAYFFAKGGFDVVLLESNKELAREASFSNGGQLSYSYVAPLSEPAILPKIPLWLFDRESPLRFVPRFDPLQWLWCLRFLKACRSETVRSTTAQLLALSFYSRDVLHELVEREGLEFCYRRNGKLVLYRDRAAFTRAQRQLAYQAQYGSAQQALDSAACIALEPAFEHLKSQIVGGIYTPSEEVGDCHSFTLGVAAAATRRFGVRFEYDTKVEKLRCEGNKIVAARTARAEVAADLFVIAAATGSLPLLTPLGLRLPLYPLTGYSLTAPLQARHRPPSISVTDLHHKIVFATLGDQLRIAGMVDLVGRSPQFNYKRAASLKNHAKEVLPDGADYDSCLFWSAGRPAMPDSKPLLGITPFSNLWLNTGHGALGFTLACGSAALLAAVALGHSNPVDMLPFAFDRWR